MDVRSVAVGVVGQSALLLSNNEVLLRVFWHFLWNMELWLLAVGLVGVVARSAVWERFECCDDSVSSGVCFT